MQNDVLATGIMSFLMHEIVYFGRSLPWIIIDHIPYFNKYKIQNVRDIDTLERKLFDANSFPAKSAHSPGTMELRETCASLSFHCRAPPDMVGFYKEPLEAPRTDAIQAFPPNGSILRTRNGRPLPFVAYNGLSNRPLLCCGRHLALLVAPRPALGAIVQEHPQDSPPILRAVWYGCRIRLPD